MTRRHDNLHAIRDAMDHHLCQELIPFWQSRCVDAVHGGFLTNFDDNGQDIGTPEKYLNAQMRLVWAFSRFGMQFPEKNEFLTIARGGVDFLIEKFWDQKHGGWVWKTHADGSPLDNGKVVYGQSFAIYALAEFFLASRDHRALSLACQTFDLLQKFCTDTARGGYFENLEPDWTLSGGGRCAGDRKSLDTHMHLMESFSRLHDASANPIHRRKLQEVVDLICRHMIDAVSGCGGNQFDVDFRAIPAITIRRTWNAERDGDTPPTPTDTTSYGHNVELAWLLRCAAQSAAMDLEPLRPIIRRLLDHAMEFGVDREYGGVYRDGERSGPALILEKEFWQHAEVLVGFLDGYELFGDERCLDAFCNVWSFVDRYMINHEVGEWRTLLDRSGRPIDAHLGNPWKVCYHSARSMIECTERLQRLLHIDKQTQFADRENS